MLLRLIILAILFYLVAKIVDAVIGFFRQTKPKSEVRGKSRSKPLDLTKEDIEDVNYKETPEDKN